MPLLPRLPNGKPMGPQFEREQEIEILRDIGFGRYGQVQQAKLGDSFIAIKKFSPYDRQSFINELVRELAPPQSYFNTLTKLMKL